MARILPIIRKVKDLKRDPARRVLACLDAPRVDDRLIGVAIGLEGWVLARGPRPVAVELVLDGRGLRRVELDQKRPDVLDDHPGYAASYAAEYGGAACGFNTQVEVRRLSPRFVLEIVAVDAAGGRLPLFRIKGRMAELDPGYTPRMLPVPLVSPGRSGTTLAMRLLAEHPALLTTRRHPYEGRAAQFFLQLYPFLARERVQPTGTVNDFYAGRYVGLNPFFMPTDEGREWIAEKMAPDLLGFALRQIDSYYGHLAKAYRKPGARWFVEKVPLGFASLWLMQALYPELRPVVLVRDFRDVLCSIRAFDSRRKYHGFGVGADLGEAVERLAHNFEQYAAYCREHKHAVVLRYEDLVREPDAALERLLAGLGLDHDATVRRGMLAAVERAGRDADTAEHMTSTSATASMGRWKRDLDATGQELASRAFASVLAYFGYEI